MTETIAFIGAGNMAGALIAGLLADGTAPEHLIAADPNSDRCETLGAATGIRTEQDNRKAAAVADILVLAVKPQILRDVAQQLAPLVQQLRDYVFEK